MKKILTIFLFILFSCSDSTMENIEEESDLTVETIQHLSTVTINAKSINGIKSIIYISFIDFDGDKKEIETIRIYTEEHILERNEDITIPQLYKPELNQFLSSIEYIVVDFKENQVEGVWNYN